MTLKKIFQSLFFLLLGLAVLYFLYTRQQEAYLAECQLKGIADADCSLWEKLLSDFAGANYAWLLVSAGIFLLSCLFRALRWQMMMRPLGVRSRTVNALGATMIAYMANLAFPRAGEFVRAGVIAKYEDISPEAAFGNIIVDRIIDVVCLGIVILLSFLFAWQDVGSYFTAHVSFSPLNIIKSYPWFFGVLTIVGLIFLGLMYKFWGRLQQYAFIQAIQKKILELWAGIRSVKDIDRPVLFLAYTIGIWVLYFLMTWASFKSFQPTAHLGLVAALVVFLFGSLGILFPSPGGMGSYHFLVTQGLLIYGVASADGFSYANIVFFTIQVLTIVFFGLMFTILLPLLHDKNSKE